MPCPIGNGTDFSDERYTTSKWDPHSP
jgi:hypothetical protein